MKRFLFLMTAVMFSLLADALEIDFGQGRVKNFRTELMESPTYTANVGLTGKSGGRIIGTNLQLNAEQISRICVYTGNEKLAYAKLYFDTDGKSFAENKMCRGKLLDNMVVFDLSAVPRWQGRIGALRIDLKPVAGGIKVRKIVIAEKQPGIPENADFTIGSMNRWQLNSAPKGTTARINEGIAFDATGKERLISPQIDLDTAKCDIIDLNMSGEFSTVKLYFSSGKEPFTESKMVRGKRNGDSVRFDMSKNRLFKGKINILRIDIYAPAGSRIAIKKVIFSKGDGPNALYSPWRHPTIIPSGKELCGSCEMILPRAAGLVYSSSETVELAVTKRDIYNNSLGTSVITIDKTMK